MITPEKYKSMAIPEKPKPRIKKWKERAHEWVSAKGQVLPKKVIGSAILKELERLDDKRHSVDQNEDKLRACQNPQPATARYKS